MTHSGSRIAVTGNRTEIVEQQLTGHLMLNLGLWDHLVLFVDLPYHFMIKDSGAGSTLPQEAEPR